MSSCQTLETQQTTISSVFPFFSNRGSRYLYQTHALFWLKNKRPTSRIGFSVGKSPLEVVQKKKIWTKAGFLHTGPKLSLESKYIICFNDFTARKKWRSFFCIMTTICNWGNGKSFISPKSLLFTLFFLWKALNHQHFKWTDHVTCIYYTRCAGTACQKLKQTPSSSSFIILLYFPLILYITA